MALSEPAAKMQAAHNNIVLPSGVSDSWQLFQFFVLQYAKW